MKVLIVDDEEEICKGLQRELRKEGYDVDYTTLSVGVLEKLREAKNKGRDYAYELLLLDLRMPEASGFEILKGIREAHIDLDVIIITAYGDEDKAVEAIRLGAIDYLSKPISLEELRTVVFRVQQKQAAEEKRALLHRLLIVDDEKELCEHIKRELDKEGYQVAVAYDGAEGLDYFKNNHVDVVIADIRMPEMDGLEMLEKCRAINSDFVSIIITGFGDHEKAIKALRLGVFEYLRKPISIEELIASISKSTDLLSLRRGLSARKRELEIEAALKTQYVERIEREKNFSKNIIATVPHSLLVLDKDLRIKSANRSCYETFQIDIEPEKVIGSSIADMLPDKDGRLSTALTRLFGTEDMLQNFELHYQSEKLGERIFNITARGILIAEEEEEEEEEEELVVIEDITKRKRAEDRIKKSLKEKEVLLREIHHRVKNNLQIISSLLNMQAMKAEDKNVSKSLLDTRSRIQTMSLIQTQLYESENLEQIEIGSTIRRLVSFLFQIYAEAKKKITPVVTAEGIILPISLAIPCGLIINELVSNALKHAFTGMTEGSIEISMRELAGDRIKLTVKDNGVGIPEELDIYKTDTLGLKIVRALAEDQLMGKMGLIRNKGTGIYIEFDRSMTNYKLRVTNDVNK